MLPSRFAGALLGVSLVALPAHAQTKVQAQGDTVVLIVKSPRGHEITFNGTVVLRDGKETRRYEGLRTPFELRLPSQDIDARFTASDWGALSGEILPFKDGKQMGHASGTEHFGAVKLNFVPGGSFGYGDRRFFARLSP